MKKGDIQKTNTRENEKGAAMVMVILVSFLLLVACAGLLLESSTNSANVTDAAAEQQAYYAAESGIQSALNVLRGNTGPLTASTESESEYWASSFNPLKLIETTASAAASPSPTPDRINFRKAVTKSASNYANDPSSAPRLSRWLNYNYTSPGSTYPDQVKVGSGSNGAFSLSISDPDKTGEILSFKTSANIYDPFGSTPGWKQTVTIGSGSNILTISYIPTTKSNLDVSDGSEDTDVGKFVIATLGTVTLSEDLRFRIITNMTAPYTMGEVVGGWILKGTYTSASQIAFEFDSPAYQIMGSTFTLNGLVSETINGESKNNLLKVSANSTKTINGSVTPTEPTRIIVKSTGYGPRGAKKQLETVVQKNFFHGMTAPATLTLVGPPTASNGNFEFYAGASQNVTYSGDDIASNIIIPSIGTTNDDNLDDVFDNLGGKSRKSNVIGYPANVDLEMPFWLESTKNLDATIRALRTVAKSSGRYFTNGQKPTDDDFGNSVNGTGITFVEGDVSLREVPGGGILVCTGKLTLHGAFSFNGLIIVTGPGGVDRSGGGNGNMRGNTVVAPYNPNNLNAGFLAPKYNISGGGTSTIRFDSNSAANGMMAVSNFVLGVVEK